MTDGSYGNIDKVDHPPCLKVVLLGNLGVGKTCLRSQFVHHIFTNAYKSTIGGDYLTATVRTKDNSLNDKSEIIGKATAYGDKDYEKVNLQIWDTAGQERFNSISQAFYRGTDVAVLVYDITNYESVLSIPSWLKRFLEHCHVQKPGIIIVGNKIDRASERLVDKSEIRRIIKQNSQVDIDSCITDWDLDLLEVSSKDLKLVEGLFQRVACLGLQLLKNTKTYHSNILSFDGIDLGDASNRKSGCAC